MMDLNILYEDKHIIVVIKPPKVPSQSDKTQDKDMITLIKEYLTQEQNIKTPYVGVVHRLDRPVGGVMVYAKSKYANSNISEQIRNKSFHKNYYAVVCGKPDVNKGTLENYLKKVTSLNMSKVVTSNSKSGKVAILDYELISSIETEKYGVLSLLKITLKTGRHHQIRVQMAHAGLPLWGDTKYNKCFKNNKKWVQIALWSEYISFLHPKTKKLREFSFLPCEIYPFKLFNK